MGRRQGNLLEEHQDMIIKIILLGLAGLTLAGEPDVFQNYFDDTIKEVDIPLDAAIKACLQNGNTLADKVKKAYADCFGSADYDFGDLAAKEGSKDSDNDGLPDSFENNEQCFYKKMGWVNEAGDLSPDAIKGDLTGLESGTKSEFDGNIDKCAGWNGDFGSRRKREAGEAETEEEASNVPSVMESGSSALGWLKAAVRKTRSAEPGNDNKKPKKKRGNKSKRGGRKGKKGTQRKRSRKNTKRSKKGKNKNRKKKRRGGKGGRKNRKARKRENKKKTKRRGKKGGQARKGKKGKKGGQGRKGNKGRKGNTRKKPRNNNGNGNKKSKKQNKNKKGNGNRRNRSGRKDKRTGKKGTDGKKGKKRGNGSKKKGKNVRNNGMT